MAIKVLITRFCKPGKTLELLNLMNQVRSTAVRQLGYICGETLVSRDNPDTVVVVSSWDGETYWESWKKDPVRKSHEDKMENLLTEPTKYEVFSVGSLPKATIEATC